MKRFIFLDFDGVMDTTHHTNWLYHEGLPENDRYGVVFNPECIGYLREIVDRTGAEIVVSSSWKDTMTYAQILQMWKDRDLPGFVTDVTPTCSSHRGDEIALWLGIFKEMSGGEECEYVIIDDLGEMDFNEDQLDHLVSVDQFYGLDEDACRRAVEILGGRMEEEEQPDEQENYLKEAIDYLKSFPRAIREGCIKARKPMLVILSVILALVAVKCAWSYHYTRNICSFESEKEDILARSRYLKSKLLVSPEKIIEAMPAAVGPQFQGEWALYSCSMYCAALVNISKIYPETREDALPVIDSLITSVMSPELRSYDAMRWGEDPLESLDGEESHISYISHLAWMISGYKAIGGDGRYDNLYHRLCSTMNRRLRASVTLNLDTYPGEYIYVPDNLVAYVALSNYSHQYGGKYRDTVNRWIDMMGKTCVDEATGLIPSLMDGEARHNRLPVKGSYTALSCYYLTFVDEEFARDQYEKLKNHFLQKRPVAGMREFHDRRCLFGMDIDAGPIIMNLSPTGTAFAIGPVTFFHDNEIRTRFLRTAELAGSTVTWKGKRHYLLADIALVGEAITLAMRTATPWY